MAGAEAKRNPPGPGLLWLAWADWVDRIDTGPTPDWPIPDNHPRALCMVCTTRWATGLNPQSSLPEPTCNWCQAWCEAGKPADLAAVLRWVAAQRAWYGNADLDLPDPEGR